MLTRLQLGEIHRRLRDAAAVEFEDRIDGSWSKIELRMKYTDGQEVRLGDRAKLGHDDGGALVAVIDTGEYTDEHPETRWGYLKREQ
jgi:hypothetical protein